MKILHIVEDFSLNSGGLRTVIKDLHEKLIETSHKSLILSSKEELGDNIYIIKTNNPWLYSKKWIRKINSLYRQNSFDVIHIHGVWMYPQFLAAKFCVKNKIPFLVSVHGMYEPWLWTKGKIKKKLYFKTLSKKHFSKANFIHCITSDEKKNLEKLFPNTRLKEIPNLIDMPTESKSVNMQASKNYILYLGRLDKKKGIDLLIKSFDKVKMHFNLIIAGPYNPYKEELEKLIHSLKLESKIKFVGLVKGEEKINLIKRAWVLSAPSYSEVVGMVNLEAASLKTPVITTFQTGLKKEWNSNGGILINPRQEELESALLSVTGWTFDQRIQKGNSLYNYVLKNYSWSNKMENWIELYKECIKK